jgi:Do/DeqQ family serine protease
MIRLLSFAVALALITVSAIAANPTALPQSTGQIQLSFAPLVKQAAPAVVNIYTKTVVKQQMFVHPFFQQFFGDMIPPEGISRERVQNSLGSGVIVSAAGLVVTANHVIDNAEQIRVVLNDRREYPARVLTQDERTDLAVLKIDVKEPLPFLPLADSDSLQVGDLVMAIGNPFGVGQTVTTGIVSALARTNVGINDYSYFIQTDAAINPGNSGGALVTMNGNLAGINSAIFSKDGGSLGIGFAIPANMVQRIIDAGVSGASRVVRPWLGIGGQPVTVDLAQSLGLPRPAGMLVNYLHAASPAKTAGLRKGDVVIALNGKPVDDPEAMKFRVAAEKIGTMATLSVVRNGEPLMIDFDLMAPPETPTRDVTEIKGGVLRGMKVANISPAVIDEYGLEIQAESGVVVVGAPARGMGVQVGDVLLAVNGEKAEAAAGVRSLLSSLQRGEVIINRAGQTVRLVINQ